MQEILFEYQLHPTTWVYIASLMMLGIFFKFRRVWSIRNLDLVGLIFIAPGLLLVSHGVEQQAAHLERFGYTWLFVCGVIFLTRLLLDPLMVRRPLLEPNLSAGGLTFTMVALLLFLMANVITGRSEESNLAGGRRLDQVLARRAAATSGGQTTQGPGYSLFHIFAEPTRLLDSPEPADDPEAVRQARGEGVATRITAVVAHLLLVVGLVLIGYRHFDNVHTGVAMAALYLLLPYTSQMTSRIDHVVPGALLTWAVAAYRRPVIAGLLLGVAGGMIYYPLFLLPLWCGFYWRRGLTRFVFGVVAALLAMVAILAVSAANWPAFLTALQQMFNFPGLAMTNLDGFWEYHEPAFRIPVVVAFVTMCGSMVIWPAQKNLGTLLSLSGAVMLGLQFWHAHQGGIYLAWYLPLLILTVFRPNLEDRVALTAVGELRFRWSWLRRWFPWGKANLLHARRAA